MQLRTRVLLQLAMYSLIISFSMSCVGLRSAITCMSHSSAGMKVWKYSPGVTDVLDAATRAAIFFWKVSFASCCLYTVKVSHSGSCTSCWVMCGATCIALCTRYERAYVAASGSPKPRTICTIMLQHGRQLRRRHQHAVAADDRQLDVEAGTSSRIDATL